MRGKIWGEGVGGKVLNCVRPVSKAVLTAKDRKGKKIVIVRVLSENIVHTYYKHVNTKP